MTKWEQTQRCSKSCSVTQTFSCLFWTHWSGTQHSTFAISLAFVASAQSITLISAMHVFIALTWICCNCTQRPSPLHSVVPFRGLKLKRETHPTTHNNVTRSLSSSCEKCVGENWPRQCVVTATKINLFFIVFSRSGPRPKRPEWRPAKISRCRNPIR